LNWIGTIWLEFYGRLRWWIQPLVCISIGSNVVMECPD
jgi:hypothetical protein